MSTVTASQTPMFDRLSPYEIAVLEFTSPAEISTDDTSDSSAPILLTSKASYLWAGAIAHVLVNRPSFTEEDVLDRFSRAVQSYATELRDIYLGPVTTESLFVQTQLGLNILKSFLQAADFSEDAISEVSQRTEEAVRRLQEAQLIQDPLKKWVRNTLLSVVALLTPVNYTSETVSGHYAKLQIDSIAASYSSVQDGDRTERHVKIKTQKAAKLLKEKLVPTIEDILSLENGNGG